VLKKAGIVVAAAATGLLALSPLAFAHESHGSGDVTYTNVEEGNLSNDCDFSQEGPDVLATATGGNSGLLGLGNLVTQAVVPVTAQTQAANCNNIGISDVVYSDSNNTTEEFTRTDIDDSFNTTTSDDDDDPFGPGFPFN